MKRYYVNIVSKEDGIHEVHHEQCKKMPVIIHAKFLGTLPNCKDAIEEAKKTFAQSKGCKVCLEECHSS